MADKDSTTEKNEPDAKAKAAKPAKPAKPAKAAKPAKPASGRFRSCLPTKGWIGVAAACLVVGALVGQVLIGGLHSSGKTKLSQDELGTTVATYTYNGKTENVTARQAIEATTQLDKAKGQDGTYGMPSADSILSCVRSKIVADAVEEEGMTASDDDAKAYAKKSLGTDDYDVIAKKYNLSTDEVQKQLKQSAATRKLYDKVVGSTDLTAPVAPEKDKDAATYGAYITGLMGSEWDSSKNDWASTDGAYYSALGKDFAPDKATYEQATAAYTVAYKQYKVEAAKLAAKWSEYINGKLSNASIQLSTLVS